VFLPDFLNLFHCRADNPIPFLEIPASRISVVTVYLKKKMWTEVVYENDKDFFMMIVSF